jgi:hypothetical protein
MAYVNPFMEIRGEKKNKPIVKNVPSHKVCPTCQQWVALKDFYSSLGAQHKDGCVPICKSCFRRMSFNENMEFDPDGFMEVLRLSDKPFVSAIFQQAIVAFNKKYANKKAPAERKDEIIMFYMRQLNRHRRYQYMTYDEGKEFEKNSVPVDIGALNADDMLNANQMPKVTEMPVVPIDDGFGVTAEVVRLFGEGYAPSEYKAMWRKYEFLRQSYPQVTNLHVEALLTYVRAKCKEEAAVAEGNSGNAERWAKLAAEAAKNAKINPSQLSQADLQGGLNSFSEFIQAAEQAKDIIGILPRFRYMPNDAPDFVIWALINYLRALEDKPACTYEEVYAFYDREKADYIAQYGDPFGIFAGDPATENRENVQKFLTLPAGYEEDEEGGNDE